jgi:putative RNA 2'-phosphotransferase
MEKTIDKEHILKIKKFAAFVLRHKPFFYKINLDKEGFAQMDRVIQAVSKSLKKEVGKDELVDILKNYSGGIFKVTKDGSKVKARCGHSYIYNIDAPEGFEIIEKVPSNLYAKVPRTELDPFMSSGVLIMSNNALTLGKEIYSKDTKNFIVTIQSKKALEKGVKFYYSKSSEEYFVKTLNKDFVSINV